MSFDPRPQEGSDLVEHALHADWLVSIHASARGATSPLSRISALPPFRSTPPRGERRHVVRGGEGLAGVSIHAPARGATPVPDPASHRPACFDPRPREGSDSCMSRRTICAWLFRSTPPRWGLLQQRPSYGAQTPDTGAVHPISPTRTRLHFGMTWAGRSWPQAPKDRHLACAAERRSLNS
jgi:hypothetical protein